jgi:esterase/lipase superfamily enzyme
MTATTIVRTARTLVPLLDALLGAAAPEVKRKLNRLLAQAATKGAAEIAPRIMELLSGYPATRKWMRETGVVAPASARTPTSKTVKRPATKKAPPKKAAKKAAPQTSAAKPAKLSPPLPESVKLEEAGAPPAPVPAARQRKRAKPPMQGLRQPGAPIPLAEPAPAAENLDLGGGDGGSAEPAMPAAAMPMDAALTPKQEDYRVVMIHYATDRAVSGKKKPSDFFTGRRADKGKMTYGTCDVSIPAGHKRGALEAPSWKKLEFRQDPSKHIVLMDVSTLAPAAFFESAKRDGKQAFVFVHGFNVTFEDAARRTAQIANDLPFDGLPVLYSWPSRGSESPAAYTADEATIEWTVPHLQQFLEDLVQKSGITTLHVIAHSMGNRAVTRALELIALKRPPAKAAFHQVVLTAPDIDASTFEDLAKKFLNVARRVTLYASAGDVALKFSKALHRERRAGDAEGGILVVDGMDSVDATGVDTSFLGHSYFGSDKSVLIDLFYALQGLAASDRKATLRLADNGKYYQFLL